MGLFSNKETGGASRRQSSDAQLREMRTRARRRLVGALVLVLAAVVIVPFLTSNDSENMPEPVMAVIPAIVPPVIEAEPTQGTAGEQDTGEATGDEGTMVAMQQPTPVTPGNTATQPPATGSSTPATQQPAAVEPPKPVVTQPTRPATQPSTPPPPPPRRDNNQRTDDGAVALALLEGRTPPSSNSAAASGSNNAQRGNFILQIAAYSSENDAQTRRRQLVNAGVTNAYVESTTSGGKTAYRLRVGPFPTREAAQAAQTRLRSLGYANSFISTK